MYKNVVRGLNKIDAVMNFQLQLKSVSGFENNHAWMAKVKKFNLAGQL